MRYGMSLIVKIFRRIFFCRRDKHRYSSMGYYGNTVWCKDCGKEKHYTPVGLRQ